MQTYFLENDILKISINSKGAELLSLYNKETQLEYLWNGDANYWPKTSPVLFPVVGGLKNNQYSFKGIEYTLTRHGFARDNEYSVEQIDATRIVFTLKDNERTRENYPFHFVFSITYFIEGNKVYCKYAVSNSGIGTMYFSVGAHPAFKIPLTDNTDYEDWFLEFGNSENCGIYPIAANGLIETNAIPFFNNSNQLKLTKELFYKDALIFKELQSKAISIKSNQSSNGLRMLFDGFPYYGIWAAKDANFVCLEPWCGIGDMENTIGDITKKEGIETLNAQGTFERTWSVELF